MTYTYFDIETSGLQHNDVLVSYAYMADYDDGKVFTKVLGVDYEDEYSLLESMTGIVKGTLVTYNGETWKGGFDLPFLRTRFAVAGLPWPFRNAMIVDLFPVVQKFFNTASTRPKKRGEGDMVARDDRQDSVYRILGGDEKLLREPNVTGAECVALFQEWQTLGNLDALETIRRHNTDDVMQLEYIHSVIMDYAPKRKLMSETLKKR